ncbi:MAG: hypothetical protein RLZZ123_437 [Pseudomonadota bacterium]
MNQGLGREPGAVLAQGSRALGLHLSPATQAQLLDFVALLLKWNRVYNLTALRDPQEAITHHVLDSLSLLSPLLRYTQGRPTRVLDVGSGGGLPGVVLAICRPELDVTCVDAVAKKAAFIQQVAGTLGLGHLHGVHARVETLTQTWPLITSRAFASLADFTAWSQAALAPGGCWLAMKGKRPDQEIAALPASVQVFHVEPLEVPGLAAQRCLVWMAPSGQAPLV